MKYPRLRRRRGRSEKKRSAKPKVGGREVAWSFVWRADQGLFRGRGTVSTWSATNRARGQRGTARTAQVGTGGWQRREKEAMGRCCESSCRTAAKKTGGVERTGTSFVMLGAARARCSPVLLTYCLVRSTYFLHKTAQRSAAQRSTSMGRLEHAKYSTVRYTRTGSALGGRSRNKLLTNVPTAKRCNGMPGRVSLPKSLPA